MLEREGFPKKIEDLGKGGPEPKRTKSLFPEFYKYLVETYPQDMTLSEKVYLYFNNLTERPKCIVCGKNDAIFINARRGYRQVCSVKCSRNKPGLRERTKKTCLERYGDENFNNRKKASQTCLERYGAKNPYASEIIKEHIKNIYREKYGVEYPSQSPQIQATRKKNTQEKYGVDHHSQLESVKNKIRESNHIFNLKHLKDEGVIGYTEDGQWKIQCSYNCDRCKEKYFIINPIKYNYYKHLKEETNICTRLHPSINKNSHNRDTTLELIIRDILNENNIIYDCNRRDIIDKELDIYIPKSKLAIECNGIMWHSKDKLDSKNFNGKNYHVHKFLECQKRNIELLTIWQDWIVSKRNIVNDIILKKLNIYSRSINIDNTSIRELKKDDAYIFLEKNNIYGASKSNRYIGIIYKDSIAAIAAISIKKDTVIIDRLCTSLGTKIENYENVLIEHIKNTIHPKCISINSFNDVDEHSIYRNLNMKTDNIIHYRYWYINRNTYIRYSKLPKNAKREDYFKISDTGYYKYKLEII